MTITFGFDGFDDLLRKLGLLRQVPSRPAAERAVLEGAQIIVEQAKRLVPVRTGRLRDSITARLGDGGGANVGFRGEGVSVTIGPDHRRGWYGHFIEFGTVDQPARPFMRPAFDSRHRAAERKIAAAMKVEIRRVAGA